MDLEMPRGFLDPNWDGDPIQIKLAAKSKSRT